MKASIIIAVRNNLAWTKSCLDSVITHTDFSDEIQLIVVDNGSREKMNTYLKNFMLEDMVHQIKDNEQSLLIENSTNTGSYYAWDQGIKKSNGEYVCILHNDCIVTKNWLKNLINFMDNFQDEYDEIGVVSPCTNYVGETEHVPSKELMEMYVENIKYSNKSTISTEDIQEIIKKTYPNGIGIFADSVRKNRKKNYIITNNIATFCCLFKKSLYEEHGPFDFDFYPHTYAEKLIKFQLDLNGIMTACCYDSFVHHNGNTTSDGAEYSLQIMEDLNKSLYESKMKVFYEEGMAKPY